MKRSTTIFNSLVDSFLNILFIKRGSWKREKYFFLVSSIILIPINWFRGKRRISRNVESQFDKISGSYIKDNYYVDKSRYCIVDDQIKSLSSIENMKNIRKECNEILSELNFSSVLEIGVGELTTLESVVSANQNIKQVFGIDLSLNRMLHGLEEYRKRQKLIPALSKSNAINLPFEDSVFDLVYSRHTLEQMPLIFRIALDEMIRISKRYIVLFEPSFEKGSFTQKLKMIRNDYFRGLDKYLETRNDIKISKSYLMKNSANPLNRTACYVLEKLSLSKDRNQQIDFVCPISKQPMKQYENFLYSPDSQLAYPIIQNIPVLDEEHSFYIDPSEISS